PVDRGRSIRPEGCRLFERTPVDLVEPRHQARPPRAAARSTSDGRPLPPKLAYVAAATISTDFQTILVVARESGATIISIGRKSGQVVRRIGGLRGAAQALRDHDLAAGV